MLSAIKKNIGYTYHDLLSAEYHTFIALLLRGRSGNKNLMAVLLRFRTGLTEAEEESRIRKTPNRSKKNVARLTLLHSSEAPLLQRIGPLTYMFSGLSWSCSPLLDLSVCHVLALLGCFQFGTIASVGFQRADVDLSDQFGLAVLEKSLSRIVEEFVVFDFQISINADCVLTDQENMDESNPRDFIVDCKHCVQDEIIDLCMAILIVSLPTDVH